MSVLLESSTAARLERLVVLARRVRPPRRRRFALKQPGRGVEPGSRRDYAPGDDLRLVDWPAYARLDRLLVKVQEELPEPRLDLLLDASGSMAAGDPPPLERAALAAAALAAVAVARDVRVVLWWCGEALGRHELRRPGQLRGLLRFLAVGRAGGPSALDRGATLATQHLRHPGAALLLSDGLNPELPLAARRLRARGCELRALLVEPELEVPPAVREALAAGGLAELVDAETGARELRPLGPLALAAARTERDARLDRATRELEQAGVTCLRLPPADPFEATARALLRA
ncbi:MAG: DUF58 domain-containing protein [Planctomycetota bacterium]